MKKYALLLGLSSLMLSACGGGGSSNRNDKDSTDTTTPTTGEVLTPSTSVNGSPSTSLAYEIPDNINPNWEDDGVLRILSIGNSFSDDTMEYVADIAISAGVKQIFLGNLFIGGCTLEKHYNNTATNSPSYEYRTNTGRGWTTIFSYRMGDALASQDWDFVSIQQSSSLSGQSSSYEPYMSMLIEYVKEKAPNAKIVFNMTWAYQQNSNHGDFPKYDNDQMTMYNAIASTMKEVVIKHEDISSIIPCGTAIQNLRTSFIGDTLTRDGYHLSYDIGRYIAGLTLFHTLTRMDIDAVFMPSGITPTYRETIIQSVYDAVDNPLVVTDSKYKDKPEIAFDESKYQLIDLELTPFAYWNAADINNYNRLITSASNSSSFYASKRFTQDEIPVGSVIILELGWQYRPECWRSDAVQSYRPPITTAEYFEVDSTFWNGYLYRAFNISQVGNPSLEGSEDAALVALKVYIPK